MKISIRKVVFSRRLRTAIVALLVGSVCASAYGDYRGWKRYSGWTPNQPVQDTNGDQIIAGCPIESPGGRFLFTARMPSGNLDIWVYERTAPTVPFGPGAPLPEPANDPAGTNDFCPTPLQDSELYFVSARAGGCGSADILFTANNPVTGYATPVNLGCAPDGPNTPGLELSPAILKTRWGTFLYFSTDYYSGDGTQDICRSRMRSDGSFSPCVLLPYPINTEYDDRQPNLSQDGRELVFASNRPTDAADDTGFDIFTAKRRFLFSRWRRAVNLSETVPFDTVKGSETRPSLSWDGDRLYYGSGGVWISERR